MSHLYYSSAHSNRYIRCTQKQLFFTLSIFNSLNLHNMRKRCLILLVFFIVSACQKNNSPLDNTTIGLGDIGNPNTNIGGQIMLTSDKDFAPNCAVTLNNGIRANGGSPTTELVTSYLECSAPQYIELKWPKSLPFPKMKKVLCKKCSEQLPRDIIRPTVFPFLLDYLDLSDTSPQAQISEVHDYLQKFNAIIGSALAGDRNTPTPQDANRKLKKVIAYYMDVYLRDNAPLSPEDFIFFMNYALLITDWEMVIPTRWAQDLFYIGEPIRFITNPDGTYKVVGKRDPFPFSIGAKEQLGSGPTYHTITYQLWTTYR